MSRKKHKGIELFTEHDLHYINEYRANRAMHEHSISQGSAFMGVIFLIAAFAAANLLPETALGYKNFNGWVAIVCFGIAFIFGLISKASHVHIDPTDKFGHENDH